MGRARGVRVAVACVALAAGACAHASKVAPSQWGRTTVFGEPAVVEFGARASAVRTAIRAVLDEMDLEIRWQNLTAVDGEYVFRSARQQKMKITYQALYPTTTRVEIYSATEERTLQDLVLRALEEKLGVAATRVSARGYNRLQPGEAWCFASLRSASTPL